MNWLDGINQVINYIENNLEDEIDYNKISEIFGYSTYHVQRLFTMITGVPMSEYIRNRKLSKAAEELQTSDIKVIDVALKYGYNSPNSFSRAFKVFHGVVPSDLKKSKVLVKAFPPLYFELTVKGAKTLNYRIEEKEAFRIVGIKLTTTLENGECYSKIPEFWANVIQEGDQEKLLALMNNQPLGLLGISNYSTNFSTGIVEYYIGCSTSLAAPNGMEEYIVPKSTWAIFPCDNKDPEAIQQLEKRIVMEWMPSSNYEFAKAPDIEVYTSIDKIDIWVPIKRVNR